MTRYVLIDLAMQSESTYAVLSIAPCFCLSSFNILIIGFERAMKRFVLSIFKNVIRPSDLEGAHKTHLTWLLGLLF